MCGIFGAVVGDGTALRRDQVPSYIRSLFELSESRGKEAAGLAMVNKEAIVVYKRPVPASKFVNSRAFGDLVSEQLETVSNEVAFIGHSRLVTDGDRQLNLNNQPVQSSGIVGIHNGIIVNHRDLWQSHPELERHAEIDSEVIFALIRKYLGAGQTIEEATAATFAELDGAASIACFFDDRDALLLATNNGSLYYRASDDGAGLVFSSEEHILRQFFTKTGVNGALVRAPIARIEPGEGVWIDLAGLAPHPFSFADGTSTAVRATDDAAMTSSPRSVLDCSPKTAPHVRRSSFVDFDKIAERFPHRPPSLRRCSRCVLPETMPFIEFDSEGVCNFCHSHQPNVLHGHEALEELVAPYRKRGKHDCLVALSGGRDSIYGLHYVKKELGMNPVAYTYDWGMVTDLARRNCSRICGRLGIEHILVSADIQHKRANIRRNVEAWLARPALGAVPLFMAGDKAYFYFLGKVGEQLGTDISFLCENLLERTNFKVGFAGVAPEVVDADHTYTLGLRSKTKLLGFFAKQFLTNRRYLNASLLDSAKAFAFFYMRKRTDHNLFRYIPWVEETVVSTIRDEYDFELAPDTTTTWRIGDGTAAFYNYIYHTLAGLTENDTFRSNQIREGVLDRERALELVAIENQPRFESISWYLETIGISGRLEHVLDTINRAPKRYSM